jgi:prepilin-type processing-associated H-X9-DG protein
MFVGEVIESHTSESGNCWLYGSRHGSSMRSTENPLNTPPGEGVILSESRRVNGAFASRHPGGAMFGFGDGHVSFLSENIDLETYRALSTRAGGESVTVP